MNRPHTAQGLLQERKQLEKVGRVQIGIPQVKPIGSARDKETETRHGVKSIKNRSRQEAVSSYMKRVAKLGQAYDKSFENHTVYRKIMDRKERDRQHLLELEEKRRLQEYITQQRLQTERALAGYKQTQENYIDHSSLQKSEKAPQTAR